MTTDQPATDFMRLAVELNLENRRLARELSDTGRALYEARTALRLATPPVQPPSPQRLWQKLRKAYREHDYELIVYHLREACKMRRMAYQLLKQSGRPTTEPT